MIVKGKGDQINQAVIVSVFDCNGSYQVQGILYEGKGTAFRVSCYKAWLYLEEKFCNLKLVNEVALTS